MHVIVTSHNNVMLPLYAKIDMSLDDPVLKQIWLPQVALFAGRLMGESLQLCMLQLHDLWLFIDINFNHLSCMCQH